jgi:hypothetical protein
MAVSHLYTMATTVPLKIQAEALPLLQKLRSYFESMIFWIVTQCSSEIA